YISYITETEHFGGLCTFAYNNVFIFRGLGKASFILHGILERLFAILANSPRCSHKTLFIQRLDDVFGNQIVGSHHIRFHPDPHGIRIGPKSISGTYAVNALKAGDQVDTSIVFNKCTVMLSVWTK